MIEILAIPLISQYWCPSINDPLNISLLIPLHIPYSHPRDNILTYLPTPELSHGQLPPVASTACTARFTCCRLVSVCILPALQCDTFYCEPTQHNPAWPPCSLTPLNEKMPPRYALPPTLYCLGCWWVKYRTHGYVYASSWICIQINGERKGKVEGCLQHSWSYLTYDTFAHPVTDVTAHLHTIYLHVTPLN